MKTLAVMLGLVLPLLASPRAPYTLILDPTEIQTIPIHHDLDTLLIFPEEVTTIIGKGLTSGQSPTGTVLYKQGEKNKKTITLRHLDNESTVVMTIMIKDDAFVFRIVPSLEPASVIYLRKSADSYPKARKVTPQETLLNQRPLSEARKSELLRLSKEAHLLKPQAPQFYAGFSEKTVALTSTHGGLTATLTRLTRFADEDAFLFFGTIRNDGSTSVDLAGRNILLQVGKMRLFRPNKFRSDQRIIPPKSSVKIEGLLIGDGKGSPLHLSLENQFRLQL